MSKRIKVKPGKTQSKLGFAVGIVFVIIGCVVVIPVFGPFGVFWTIIAGFIAFSHMKNAFTDEGMPTHEIIIDEERDAETVSRGVTDIEDKMNTLRSLYEQGLITAEEYEKKRRDLLDKF